MRHMRRGLLVVLGVLSALLLSTATIPVPAIAADAPIGRIGDTLRVQDARGVIADVTVLPVALSPIPPGFGYPPRAPRHQVYKAPVVVQTVQAPNPSTMAVSFQFRGVTPTGDAYEPRNTDAPDDLRAALITAPQGATVGGAVYWDCYRDLVSTVVLIDKQTGYHLAQWNL
jgi:hypothetical protein